MSKGGPLHTPAPAVDEARLAQFMQEHVEAHGSSSLHFGVYEQLSRAQAVSAEGMHQNCGFLLGLCQAIKGSRVVAGALVSVILPHSVLNYTQLKNELWAGQRAERVLTLLGHVRRLADPVRLKQALSKATSAQAQSLQKLAKLVQSTEGEEQAPIRQLAPQLSLDSDGFPAMLASPKPKERPREADEASAASTIPVSEGGTLQRLPTPEAPVKRKASSSFSSQDFAAALEAARAAAAAVARDPPQVSLPRPKKKGKGKGKAEAKASAGKPKNKAKAKAAASKAKASAGKAKAKAEAPAPQEACKTASEVKQVETKSWGPLWITRASEQSYLQYKDEKGGKVLLISCSKKSAEAVGKSHVECIQHLAQFACTAKNKDQVKTERDLWLQAVD